MTEPSGDLRKQWGEAVRARREELGLSQAELATAVGLHQTAISRLENGQFYPSVPTQLALARELRREVDELFPRSSAAVAEAAS